MFERWRRERPTLTADALELCGEVVVELRERPFQELLANELCSRCKDRERVLEVGYGVGMTQSVFSRYQTLRHTIVEGNSWLAANACALGHDSLPVVVFDTWQNAVQRFPDGFFQGILFDPYVFDEEMPEAGAKWSARFAVAVSHGTATLPRIMRKGGLFGFINFEPELGIDWILDLFFNEFELEYRGIPPDDSLSEPWEVWLLKKVDHRIT